LSQVLRDRRPIRTGAFGVEVHVGRDIVLLRLCSELGLQVFRRDRRYGTLMMVRLHPVSAHEMRAHRVRSNGRGRKMIRRIVSMLALVAGSILLTLLVRETELRARGYEPLQISRDPVGWAEPDLELGWKNRQGSFRSTEPGHAMMSFGPDGRRIDPVGPKDTPKILLVGDSFAQGEGLPTTSPIRT